MPRDQMHFDYETFCEASLPDVGTRNYARHPSLEVLMAAWAINDGPVQQWVPAEGQPIPAEFQEALLDPEVEKWAWNAPFEIEITDAEVAEVDVTQYRDAMVAALALSLPGSLEKAGDVVGLKEHNKKDRRGGLLMRKFSFPRKPSKNNPSTRNHWHQFPKEWELYKAYNRQDVTAERGFMRAIRRHVPDWEEWELWFLDQQINSRGRPINLAMVRNAIRLYEEALGDATLGTGAFGEMARLTGLANPNSIPQALPWLQSRGYMFDDMKKGHIKTALRYFSERPEHWDEDQWAEYKEATDLKRVLELRLETGRTSIKKYYTLLDATTPIIANLETGEADYSKGHLCYSLQMNGAARTGRWGGRLDQPQNPPRPEKRFEPYQDVLAQGIESLDLEGLELVHGNVFDALASGIRPTMQAPEGMVLIDADLSAIENVLLGWLSGCQKILRVFENDLDPYISFAVYLYNEAYDALWHEYKVEKKGEKRQISKPGTLGCGYGMGPGQVYEDPQTGELEATGLVGYAWNMGILQFTLEDAKHSVETFRREYSEVVDHWYDLERMAKKCVRTGRPTEHGYIRFVMDAPFLKMILPSGRKLSYLRPRLEKVDTPWGDKREQLTYEGLNDRKQWVRMHTTPGKLTENADQAIARDALVHGMRIAMQRGIDVRLHVHDQIVALAREDDAERQLKVLQDSMAERPWWGKDIPLRSSGQITKVFLKD